MSCLDIDEIIQQINKLLDEQLAFLNRDLHYVDVCAWQEYESRYNQIRLLCEQLGGDDVVAHESAKPSLMVV